MPGYVGYLVIRPDRWDVIGSLICVAGVAVIMSAPRAPVS